MSDQKQETLGGAQSWQRRAEPENPPVRTTRASAFVPDGKGGMNHFTYTRPMTQREVEHAEAIKRQDWWNAEVRKMKAQEAAERSERRGIIRRLAGLFRFKK